MPGAGGGAAARPSGADPSMFNRGGPSMNGGVLQAKEGQEYGI